MNSGLRTDEAEVAAVLRVLNQQVDLADALASGYRAFARCKLRTALSAAILRWES